MTTRRKLLLALLAEAWPVWIGIGVPVLLWYVAPLLLPNPKSILYVGVALEALGVIAVAYELIEIREQFESPGVIAIARRWLARLRNVLVAGEDTVDAPTDAAKATESAGASKANRSAPDQIVAMMKLLDAIYRRLDTLQRLRALEDRLAAESAQATSQLEQLARQIQTLSLGNIGREFVGACFIVLGLLMANLPEEFYHLWRAL